MFDVNKIRKDFPMLRGLSMQNKPLIYLDNAATSLRPQCVIDSIVDYYSNYSCNSHRGDYDLAHKVDQEIEQTGCFYFWYFDGYEYNCERID